MSYSIFKKKEIQYPFLQNTPKKFAIHVYESEPKFIQNFWDKINKLRLLFFLLKKPKLIITRRKHHLTCT